MKKFVITISLSVVFLCGLIFYQYIKFSDKKLHIVFCDVGQGDAIYIRTPNGSDILIDGGPDGLVLNCLTNHMPMWDKEIDIVFLSHPHADHFIGLIEVMKRYRVHQYLSEKLVNHSEAYKAFEQVLSQKAIPVKHIYQNDRVRLGSLEIKVLGPSHEFLRATSPHGTIAESQNFGSLLLHMSYGSFDALFTGDMQDVQLSEDTKALKRSIELFQVPHHGSKSGFSLETIKRISPELAIISVGQNNYGHPAKSILELLSLEKTRYKRTDNNGTVEVITDGKTIEVQTEK